MSRHTLLAPLIAAPGTRQADRHPPQLDPAHAPLDGRDETALLLAARALAGQLRYYGHTPDTPDGNWSEFFPAPQPGERPDDYRARLAALADTTDGSLAPHLALLLAVLRVARHPRALLDDFTRRHLEFQLQTALGFEARPPQPDHAHVLIQLKKGAAPVEIKPEHSLSAGKDASNTERIYRPVRPVVAGQASIARLCATLHHDGRLGFAPVADSANGLGEKLPADAPDWSPFGLTPAGQPMLPDAPVGFAFAAAVLRLAEGERKITLSLGLAGLTPETHTGPALAAAFSARLSGPKGWLGPFRLDTSSVSGSTWSFSVTVPAGAAAVVDALPAALGQPFPAGLPVIQLLLNDSARFDLAAGLRLRQASIKVTVAGIHGLQLESEFGKLDPTKAFLPFGPQAAPGTCFYIGCPEALGKPLSDLSLQLVWQNAPATQADLTTRYARYSGQSGLAFGVKADAGWADLRSTRSRVVTLIPSSDGRIDLGPNLDPAHAHTARKPSAKRQMLRADSAAARLKIGYARRQQPMQPDDESRPLDPRAGYITLSLKTDLLHVAWRSEAVAALIAKQPALAEPWTPKLQSISLNYTAQSGTAHLDDERSAAFSDAAIEFFHVDAFGVAREHLWLNRARPWADQGAPSLLPPHPAAGELLIGIAGSAAGAPLSLLFQVADGSADPQAASQTLAWSVLADNAWRPLASGTELTLDTTRSLRTSGIVAINLPAETTTDNTRMPSGLVWLRAAIPAQPGAACRLVGVHCNAVEVAFEHRGNAASHLASALPAGSIARFLVPPAGLKGLAQPYASFGGALREDATALARRATERLRHRGRAISPRDFEHLVLQAFPGVDRVKCIPHARPDSWFAPGYTTLVVVPDLRQRNAVDPLQPRVDLDTLERIRSHILARATMGLSEATLTVKNPGYRPVLLDFKVAMRPGYAFSYYRRDINAALVRALSPWAFDSAFPLDFGGRVIRSALVDFVESLEWVDYVTDFRLTLAAHPAGDSPELAPDAPDAILVSAPEHLIEEIR